MKKNKRKKKVVLNLIFNIIALISTIMAIVFAVYIYKLDMIPDNYLRIFIIALIVIYLILLCFTLPRHMKIGFKIVACIFLLIFAFTFGYGIKYADKTISFIDVINDELKQKEEYSIKTLQSNNVTEDNLNNKKIGVFKNENYDKLTQKLKKKYPKIEIIDYTDPITFYEDLTDGKIDAVIASDNVYGLLETELEYLKLELKKVDKIDVPVDTKEHDIVKIVDVTNTPFNIFVAGGDAWGSITKVMNTDVNMVVSVDPINHKLLLTSIPRDYYVILPSKGENVYDKLTHAGYYGVEESVKTVEKLLDIDINYYAKVNFSTIEKVVDAIGGIEVNSDYRFRFYEPENGMNFVYKKGINKLNGKQALGFARERSSFNDGDVQRVKNQQKVISGIIDKVSSSKTIINKYTDILDAISKSFATNLDSKSISRLVKMQLNDMRGWDVESQNLVGYSATSRNCYSIPNMSLYVMKQDENSVKSASEKIKTFIGK